MDTFKKVDLPTIIVEECNADCCSCKRCGHPVRLGSLRVSYIRNSHIDYLHIECFKPRNYVPILENNIMISVADTAEASKVVEWITQWNLQFERCQVFDRQLEKTTHQKNRLLMNVFEYLTVEEMLVAAQVCKTWYNVTWENELWRVLILRDFKADVMEGNRKAEYMQLYKQLCMNCHQPATPQDICPILRRPLCLACRTVTDHFKDKYGLLSKQQILEVFEVDSRVLKHRKLKWTFSKQNHKLTYLFLFMDALNDLRRCAQAHLVEFLANSDFNSALVDWTRQLDVKELHTLVPDGIGGYSARSTFVPLDVPWSGKAQLIHEFLRTAQTSKAAKNELYAALHVSIPCKRRRR